MTNKEAIERLNSDKICGHCTNWGCDNPLNMTGHCTIDEHKCGYGYRCNTYTKFQCKWAYTRPATEEEKGGAE